MPEREQLWLFEVRQRDCEFLRKMGIKPYVIDDPAPKPPLEEVIRQCEMTHVLVRELLTKADHEWLKAMAVAWKREPAFQLSLDFCGHQEPVGETHTFREAHMTTECSSCHGTGKCPQCKGTGRLGYPGYGQVDAYKTPCIACQQSGVCRVCKGTGQR